MTNDKPEWEELPVWVVCSERYIANKSSVNAKIIKDPDGTQVIRVIDSYFP